MILINLAQNKSKNKYISNILLNHVKETLEKQEKIILYLNKRWEYSSLICKDCNKIFKCKNCDNSLTIHNDKMVCHICWYTENIKITCPDCNSKNLEKIWVWTKQIETFLKSYFPKANIFRFDTDTVKNKTEKENALNKLKNAEIIIWTKMITTGFDFEKVGLISIILLEQELQNPRYDTEEKLYANIKQLIWRWWRKWQETKFIAQTFIPENKIIKNLTENNYKDFFKKTLLERKLFSYPPFKEYAILEYRNKDKQKALNYTEKLKEKLDKETKDIEIVFQKNSFKKYNQFYYKIILKWENIKKSLNCIKKEIFSEKNLVVIFG